MEIFKLFGSIMVDTKDAESSISKTTNKAEGFGTKLKSGIKTAAKWGAAIVGAATAVGGAMIAASKDTASTLDVIDKASIRMGVSAESYQELAHAANLSGVKMTTLEKAAKSLVDTDMSFDEALDQLMSIGDESERTAAAVEMFGEKVAYDMQPLLQSGAEGLASMKQEANDLGLVMSQETVSAGAQLNDMFSKVESSLSTLKTSLMADLMPYVMDMLQWVIDNVPQIKETVKSVVEAVWPIVKAVLDLIMEALPPIMEAVKKVLDWIMPYLKPVIESITGVIEGLFALLKGDTEGFAESIKTLFKNLGTSMFGIGKDILNGLWNGLKAVWTSLSNWISGKVTWIKDKLTIWKDSKLAMDNGTDGSHASGLNYVPYDGYQATLHKGETVLSNGNSQSMVSDIVNALAPFLGGGAQTLQVVLDSKVIAEALYDPLDKVQKGRGVAYG